MKKTRKLKVFIVLFAVAVMATLLAGIIHSFDSQDGNSPRDGLSNAKELLASAETLDGRALFISRKEMTLYYENPQAIMLPFVAISRAKTTKVKLREILVTDTLANIRARVNLKQELEGTSDIAPSKDDVLAALIQHDTPKHKELLKISYLKPDLRVSLEDLVLKEEDSIRLFTTATFEVGKKNFSATTETLVTIASLPSRAYWYGGDGHIHSAWSPDVVGISIDSRAAYAANNGFKWLAMTDHADGIGSNWQSYLSQCNTAQTNRGIVVAPGAEITSASPHGDAPGYWLSTAKTSIPANKTYPPQQLINQINNHNPGYSYAGIAHPYGRPAWPDWSVTGFRTMELLSNERQASSSTINKWFELLRTGLSGTIAGGGFVVGTGNTDAHNIIAPGDNGFTWLYTTSYSPADRGAIWAAIEAGRVSASGRKDLGVFTLNNAVQGSVIRVTGSDTLTFNLIQQPVSGRKCTQITIRDKNNSIVKTISNPAASETTWFTLVPTSDTFYVVKFVFAKKDNTDYSHVWANPIFIDRI